MASYPVENDDISGLTEGVNYLLSGPAGLGQNFSGTNGEGNIFIKGTETSPFTSTDVPFPELYIAPIDLASGTYLDDRTIEFTFTTSHGSPTETIFIPGEIVYVYGASDDAYNILYAPIGVVACTTTTVTLRLSSPVSPIPSDCTGGYITKDFCWDQYNPLSLPVATIGELRIRTDLFAYVTVTSETDRVTINTNLIFNLLGTNPTGVSDAIVYSIGVHRYHGVPNTTSTLPKYNFVYDKPIAAFSTFTSSFTSTTSTGYKDQTFAGLFDNPPPGYYLYTLEFYCLSNGDAKVWRIAVSSRSMTVQVIKQ